ncbi:MAG TPA: hypothetical protein VF981_04665 [Gemmatimonadaceae bacterium]
MNDPRWLVRAGCLFSFLVLGRAAVPAPAGAQVSGVRFEITQVGDTTFGFPRGTAGWVKEGVTGIAVDPRRRDVLIARFLVIRVDTGFATALITGQTTRVATEHVVVLNQPSPPWYRTATFWGGTFVGVVLGLFAASR